MFDGSHERPLRPECPTFLSGQKNSHLGGISIHSVISPSVSREK